MLSDEFCTYLWMTGLMSNCGSLGTNEPGSDSCWHIYESSMWLHEWHPAKILSLYYYNDDKMINV